MSKQTIDITPSWASLLPLYKEWVDNGTPKQRKVVKDTLEQLGAVGDTLIAALPEMKKDLKRVVELLEATRPAFKSAGVAEARRLVGTVLEGLQEFKK